MKELTKAELDVMQIIWHRSKVVVHDILDEMPDPKPAYNTVSTIVRILEKKGFVGHEKLLGKTFLYHPIVRRDEYTEHFMNSVLGRFFNGSIVQMVSFFGKRDNVTLKDFDNIISILEEQRKEEIKRGGYKNEGRLTIRFGGRGK